MRTHSPSSPTFFPDLISTYSHLRHTRVLLFLPLLQQKHLHLILHDDVKFSFTLLSDQWVSFSLCLDLSLSLSLSRSLSLCLNLSLSLSLSSPLYFSLSLSLPLCFPSASICISRYIHHPEIQIMETISYGTSLHNRYLHPGSYKVRFIVVDIDL